MVTVTAAAVLVVIALVVGFAVGRRGDRPVTYTALQPPVSTPDVEALIRDGRKIEAIKRYRELHGVGLREAKDAVDALEREGGTS